MLLFDIEANALFDPTVVHCIAIAQLGKEPQLYSGERGVQEAGRRLVEAESICAHNGTMYDVPVIERLFGVKLPYCHDTLIWSRFLHPDIYDHPCGTHKPNAIDSWGKFFGLEKLGFEGPWDTYTQEMGVYCKRDVEILAKIHAHLRKDIAKYTFAVKLEHIVAKRLYAQIRHGIGFNIESAEQLLGTLLTKQATIDDEFQRIFPPLPLQMKTKVKMIPFNPGSRQMFIKRVMEKYDHKPLVTTVRNGRIHYSLDHTILAKMEYPEARLLERRLLIQKRVGHVESWIKAYEASEDGRIHGWVNSIGAVSHRMSHSSPNLAQVPKVGSPYGEECRALFIPTAGKVMVGADLSGIELRLLANRMWQFDDGEYSEIVLNGDPHTYNQKAAGIKQRDWAKNGIYCLMYGGGDTKLGTTVHRPGEGREVRDTWMKNIPALDKVIKTAKQQAKRLRYVVLLDGRHAPVRSPHMALNTQIQGDAAILHKMAMVLGCARLKYFDCHMLLNIHDEQQYECLEEDAVVIGETLVECMEQAGRALGVKTPITGAYKIGKNWRETH